MATYYISPVGNDSTGAGTLGNPWQTVSKAVTASATNDNILCDSANGNHTWANQVFPTSRNIGAYGGGTPIFDAAAGAVSWQGGAASTGIQFQNNRPAGNIAAFEALNTAATFTFNLCRFTNILIGTIGNGLFNCVSAVLTLSLTACVIDNCFGAAASPGPMFAFGNGSGTTVTMLNCTVYTNAAAAVTGQIFTGWFSVGTVTITLHNVIFANLNGTPVTFGDAALTYVGSNNNTVGYSSIPGALTNGISADPLFVDVANANFNLRPTSPCIDAGTAI